MKVLRFESKHFPRMDNLRRIPDILRLQTAIMIAAEKEKPAVVDCRLVWWRGQDSNLRPLGYEPNELPLLHPAMLFTGAKVASFGETCKRLNVV